MNMKMLLIGAFVLPFFGFSQSPKNSAVLQKSDVFYPAIAEYIKAAQQSEKLRFDTLFVGPEEYHRDKKLPFSTQNISAVLLKGEKEGVKKLGYRSHFYYVNIIENKSGKDTCEYLFIAFRVEKTNKKTDWWPLHNCYVDFTLDPKEKIFKFANYHFEYPYSNKYTAQKKKDQ